MIKLYSSPSCISCRKVKKFFKQYNIPFVEKNILKTPILRDEIVKMLTMSENGFDDIISRRSRVFQETGLDLEKMKTQELVNFIIDNPSVLRRPIIVGEIDLQVGYNGEDIEVFIPEEIRNRECLECYGKNVDCPYVKAIKFQDKNGKLVEGDCPFKV
ncbi:MAG: Spx/MgsR family RNA polymerase-binding regulatory protein [Bacilli bacterium]|nr:Spx/MgsR family RNA polymerase-binding regulatory protein [Bacilli bacterium]